MPKYNKLVRDKIPAIIKESGKEPKTSILSEYDYYKALANKLMEETKEFVESGSPEELADILEVIEALIKAEGISWDELIRIKESKKDARGGFERKILLEEVID